MATFYWNGGSGSWSAPTNWNPVGVPGSDATRSDDVVISQGFSPNINIINNDQSLANALAALTVDSSHLVLGANIDLNANGPITMTTNASRIELSGGTVAAVGGFELGAGTLLGFGTISEASGPFSDRGGKIEASNGTLDIRCTIDEIALKIDPNGILKIDGTAVPAAIELAGTLEIGATGSLNFFHGAQGLGTTIQLDGGSLTNPNGLILYASSILIGKGTINAPLSGPYPDVGLVEASGGTLELSSDIAGTPGPTFAIDGGPSTLQVDGAVGSGKVFKFLESSGELAFNRPMIATIAGLNVGASPTDPTNFLDAKYRQVTIVGGNVGTATGGKFQLSDGSVLTLSGVTGNNSGTWFVDTKNDGSGGTDIFLSSMPAGPPGEPTGPPGEPAGPPPVVSGIAAFNITTNQTIDVAAHAYTGPVADLQWEYINITPDSLNISTNTPNWFIHSGSGTDGIAVNSGTNVLDGGTGSNFLSGNGTDTFFIDDRGPTADIWSTVIGFHAGDAATIWGVTPQDFGLDWADGQGAAGYTGLTLHATAAGKPTASLTLAGYTQADLNNGRLSILFGTDQASGSAYVYIHGNS